MMLGIVGVGLAWSLAISQWLRSRRHIEGISPATWSVFCAVNLGWVAYGITHDAWFLVANGAVAAAFNLALLSRLPCAMRWSVAGITGGAAASVLGIVVSWPASVAVVTVGAIVLRVPQIVRLCTAPSVEGVSMTAWTAALVNNLVWAALWVSRGDVVMIVSSGLITSATIVLSALLVWRRMSAREAAAPAT